jgi:hypothetical protein
MTTKTQPLPEFNDGSPQRTGRERDRRLKRGAISLGRAGDVDVFISKQLERQRAWKELRKRVARKAPGVTAVDVIARRDREIAALRDTVQTLEERLERLERLEQEREQDAVLEVCRMPAPNRPALETALKGGLGNDVPTAEEEAAGEQQWQARLKQGESVRLAWVQDGLLIPSRQLAQAWGRTPQALSLADRHGKFLSLKVKGDRYYPAVFMTLEAEVVKDVCSRLKGEDAVGKFIFWSKPHGSLGGLTAADAIKAGKGEKVVQLADAWSAERGLNA